MGPLSLIILAGAALFLTGQKRAPSDKKGGAPSTSGTPPPKQTGDGKSQTQKDIEQVVGNALKDPGVKTAISLGTAGAGIIGAGGAVIGAATIGAGMGAAIGYEIAQGENNTGQTKSQGVKDANTAANMAGLGALGAGVGATVATAGLAAGAMLAAQFAVPVVVVVVIAMQITDWIVGMRDEEILRQYQKLYDELWDARDFSGAEDIRRKAVALQYTNTGLGVLNAFTAKTMEIPDGLQGRDLWNADFWNRKYTFQIADGSEMDFSVPEGLENAYAYSQEAGDRVAQLFVSATPWIYGGHAELLIFRPYSADQYHAAKVAAYKASAQENRALQPALVNDLVAETAGGADALRTAHDINLDTIEAVYNDFLGRHSDAGGLAYYTGLLDSGADTLVDIKKQFIASDEFKKLHAPADVPNAIDTTRYQNTSDPDSIARQAAQEIAKATGTPVDVAYHNVKAQQKQDFLVTTGRIRNPKMGV